MDTLGIVAMVRDMSTTTTEGMKPRITKWWSHYALPVITRGR